MENTVERPVSAIDETVVSNVRTFLRAVKARGFDPAFGVLFGSYAKGSEGPDSDIDLIVVAPPFEGPCLRKDSTALWITAGRIDSRIEPIACGLEQWEHDDGSIIIEIARREGVKIFI